MFKNYIIAILIVIIAGCAQPPIREKNIGPVNYPYEVKTFAQCSWYGPGFHGRKMANGKIFNQMDPTVVAHKKLPFGTKIQFINPSNNATFLATVQDRGPYIKGRDFDLSKGLADKLGVSGVSRLQYIILR